MTDLYIIYGVIFLFSVIMGVLIMPRIISISYRKRLVDTPNQRKVHLEPIPRLGGISFLPLTFMAIFLFDGLCVLWLNARVTETDTTTFLQMQFAGMGAMLLFLIGVADDLVGVDFKKKFLGQFCAALLFPFCGLWINNLGGFLGIWEISPYIGMPLTVFLVVYIINAINLIDGIDGLASGISIIAFSYYAAMFIFLERYVYAGICLSVLGVLLVFFYYNVFGKKNTSVRKLFMGDTGSLTLGYFISFLVVMVSQFNCNRIFVTSGALYPALSPLIIPLLDIVRVVFARYRDRVPLFHPDRRHIHHKLLRMGMNSRSTMITLLLLTFYFMGLSAFLAQYSSGTWIVLFNVISWIVMHLIFNYYIRGNERRHPERKKAFENKKNTISQNQKFAL